MALNIKNEQVVALAREVAELTGETLTRAIQVALEERIERVRHPRSDVRRRDELWADIEALRKELGPYRAGFTTDDLYDPETGLPA